MTKRPTETHTVEINGGKCNSETELKIDDVGIMLVLQMRRRDASKTLNLYRHKIAQSTSAMNVAEKLNKLYKIICNFSFSSLSFFLSLFFLSFFLFFFFLSFLNKNLSN
jgi:hypothetical protein